MSKSAQAFRTIGEVEKILGLQQHVLRYWESQIPEIQPVRRGGRSRLYRPEDTRLLAGIKKLISEDGLTIQAVQKKLKEDGVESVASPDPIDFNVQPLARPTSAEAAQEGGESAQDDSLTGSAQDTTAAPETEDAATSAGDSGTSGDGPDSADTGLSASESAAPPFLDIEVLRRLHARLEGIRMRMESDKKSETSGS